MDPKALHKAVDRLRRADRVMVLSGAGMSTAAGIPDFRSPGGLYGTSATLLDRFTYVEREGRGGAAWQRAQLQDDIRNALTHSFFRWNPLPYHEMRRGMIIGLGENQWKLTIGHVLAEILNRQGKLRLLASQNIDGLDHKVVSDKTKLYNPHGLMSALVSEPSDVPLCTSAADPIYQRYVELVKANVKDIYADRPPRQGKSSHLWPGPRRSAPISLAMLGELLPPHLHEARQHEDASGTFSLKPGTVLFDRTLWRTDASGAPCDAFQIVRECDCVLVMGTSLSGLTIDHVAHTAGRELGLPLLVFDVSTAPVDSLRRNGSWRAERDCHLQGPLDASILEILHAARWLDQLLDFLPELCLASLRALQQFVEARLDPAAAGVFKGKLEAAIADEVERERRFYGDE